MAVFLPLKEGLFNMNLQVHIVTALNILPVVGFLCPIIYSTIIA